ncbi:hypothetical protein M8J77_020980 [Diaphorina citri]|nr:hypothetical protein M8J77_020980 [Diaphorina citri]
MTNVVQINLHHSKAASATLAKVILEKQIKVALIQEPYVVKGRIAGLGSTQGTVIYDSSTENPRACIFVNKNIHCLPLWNYTTKDIAAVRLKLQMKDERKDYIFASCYLPFEETNPISTELQSLIDHVERERVQHVLGMDANAHHYAWGSSNINNRGECLLNFICNYNLVILNVGKKPTFVTRNRSEVLDITVASQGMMRIIHNWNVPDEMISSSDHRYIFFSIKNDPGPPTSYRNPRKTDWGLYRRLLKSELEGMNVGIKDSRDLDETALRLQGAILKTLDNSCPVVRRSTTKQPVWWNKKLDGNMAKPDGSYTTNGEETLEVLLNAHFPEHRSASAGPPSSGLNVELRSRPTEADWREAKAVVSMERIQAAVRTFKPFKSPGPDGIYPAFLQEGLETLTPVLCRLFRSSLALRHIPMNWRNARVVFLPKPGRRNLDQAKSYRPITLSSFLLKTMERLIDWRMDQDPRTFPQNPNQHTYQPGKSTETALNELVNRIKQALKNQEITVAVFLDIAGAFDNTSINAIKETITGANVTIFGWITQLLETRKISAEIFGSRKEIYAARGCPQGGVLSPRLWNLVANSLLVELNDAGFFTLGYADDFVILVRGKYINTLMELLQSALSMVEKWCKSKGLKVNPLKTTMVPFTKKYKMGSLVAPIIFGERISIADDVKFLGVYFDKRLTWNLHINKTTAKAKAALNMARRSVGKTWGLTPQITKWIYTAIIRPRITYASCIWWKKIEQQKAQRELESVQRLALLVISGTISTAPTLALEVILGLPPLYLFIKGEALMGAYRQMTSRGGKLPARYHELLGKHK